MDRDLSVNETKGILQQAPLHKAAEFGLRDVASFLIDNGADVNQPDANGWTPLHYCANGGQGAHCDVARLLVAGGAKRGALTNTRLTPLHLAASQPWVGVRAKSRGLRSTGISKNRRGCSVFAGGQVGAG